MLPIKIHFLVCIFFMCLYQLCLISSLRPRHVLCWDLCRTNGKCFCCSNCFWYVGCDKSKRILTSNGDFALGMRWEMSLAIETLYYFVFISPTNACTSGMNELSSLKLSDAEKTRSQRSNVSYTYDLCFMA